MLKIILSDVSVTSDKITYDPFLRICNDFFNIEKG